MKIRILKIVSNVGYILSVLHVLFWTVNLGGLSIALQLGFFREHEQNPGMLNDGTLPPATARVINYAVTYIYFISLVLLLSFLVARLLEKKRKMRTGEHSYLIPGLLSAIIIIYQIGIFIF